MKHYRISIDIDIRARSRDQAEGRARCLYSDLEKRPWIVEVLPNESEGHELLASIRQSQGRWADAIGHWEQVAKIRALEPTGLIGLASAQVHERQFDKAAETVGKLKARVWPANFPDAANRIADLERQVQSGKK